MTGVEVRTMEMMLLLLKLAAKLVFDMTGPTRYAQPVAMGWKYMGVVSWVGIFNSILRASGQMVSTTACH